MVDVLMLFPKSQGREDVNAAFGVLIPVMKAARGLRSLRVSDGDLMAKGGPPPYSGVIEASFETFPDWMAHVETLNSNEDFVRFAHIEPLVLFFEVREP